MFFFYEILLANTLQITHSTCNKITGMSAKSLFEMNVLKINFCIYFAFNYLQDSARLININFNSE